MFSKQILTICAVFLASLALVQTEDLKRAPSYRVFPEVPSTLSVLQRFPTAGRLQEMAKNLESGDLGKYEDSLGVLIELETNIQNFFNRLSSARNAVTVRDVDLLLKEDIVSFVGAMERNSRASRRCINDTGRILIGLIERKLWALKFLDASGKPSSGISNLRTNFVGDYELCRSSKVPSSVGDDGFSGDYCTLKAEIGPPSLANEYVSLMVQWGVCVPSTCNETEMTTYFSEAINLMRVNDTLLRVKQSEIHTDERQASTSTILAIVALFIIGFFMLVGTTYDILFLQWPVWRRERVKEEIVSTNRSSDVRGSGGLETTVDVSTIADDDALLGTDSSTMLVPPQASTGSFAQVLIAFSVYSNASKVLNTTQSHGSISCIHGIRFLSMSWVILGHMIAFGIADMSNFFAEFPTLLRRWTFAAVSNAFLAVDTFFLLSGLLTAYVTCDLMKRKGWKINWGLFYFHRFWRLTPPYMLVILVATGLQQYLGQGPLWPKLTPNDKHNCESYWWTNLLYINNLVHNTLDMCFLHSWYLANDMQFFLVSPIMLIALYFHRRLGILVCSTVLLVSAITTGVLSVQHHWPPSILDAQSPGWVSFFQDYYIAPWCRIGPFVIGLLTGYLIVERSIDKLRMHTIVAVIGWLVAAATALAALYGLQGDVSGENPLSVPVSALYNAVARNAWAASVAWVILACLSGWGGFVNRFLSWSPFVFLGRLSYMAYLIHPSLISIFFQGQQTLFYLDPINLAVTFMGILVATYGFAFVLMLAFESPMIGIEKIFLPRRKD